MNNIDNECKNILQITEIYETDKDIVKEIMYYFPDYKYNWFNEEKIYKYLEENKLDEFPNIIEKLKSFTKSIYRAEIFKYYWLYMNGGIYINNNLMIEKKINVENNTFISVKSYHKDLIFDGFIYCDKFNPIIYETLKYIYNIDNKILETNSYAICKQLLIIYNRLKDGQKT